MDAVKVVEMGRVSEETLANLCRQIHRTRWLTQQRAAERVRCTTYDCDHPGDPPRDRVI